MPATLRSNTEAGGVFLMGIVGAGVFVATFDANDYKPQISKQVKQQTGRDFNLTDIKVPGINCWLLSVVRKT